MSQIPYASVLGGLMYVMVATQLDLTYLVGATNRRMSNLGQKHWDVVKNIFRYLRNIEDLQLTCDSDKSTKVEGFTNFDYADNPNNRKSTLGYVFPYGGGAISWRSNLQCEEFVLLFTIRSV